MMRSVPYLLSGSNQQKWQRSASNDDYYIYRLDWILNVRERERERERETMKREFLENNCFKGLPNPYSEFWRVFFFLVNSLQTLRQVTWEK
jgi:hypothetical protein